MSDEGGGGSAATRTRSKARVMQEMDANVNNTATGNKPPSSAQTMDKIQSRYVKFNPVCFLCVFVCTPLSNGRFFSPFCAKNLEDVWMSSSTLLFVRLNTDDMRSDLSLVFARLVSVRIRWGDGIVVIIINTSCLLAPF